MRQRRHVTGNSNALVSANSTGASASVGWGAGRTVPATITSALKRTTPPPSIVTDAIAESKTQKAVKQEQKSGAATARRPQLNCLRASRDPLVGSRPNRRVQSARGASEKSTQANDAASDDAMRETVMQTIGDNTLPKLQPPIGDLTGPLKSKTRASACQRKPTPPASSDCASGIDLNSQVQWAVKVAPTAPDGQAAAPLEAGEMKDLRCMLRDRYGEKRSVRQAFLTWDTNKDGRLCAEELREMLTRLGFAQVYGQNKVDTILQHVLEMPSASLQYDDFCGLINGPTELNQSAFKSQLSSNSTRRSMDNTKVEEDIVQVSDPDCVVSLLRAKYESRRVHQVFRDWDIDKNGGVTLAEIESNLRRQGLRILKSQLMTLFDAYDLNHDGRLRYNEFMHLVYGPAYEQRYSYLAEQRRKKQHEQQTQEGDPMDFFRNLSLPQQTKYSADDQSFKVAFQRKLNAFASSKSIEFALNDAYAAFDDDHNGNLSYRELCYGLQELGLNLTDREFLHLAKRLDTDGNGEISFKEFCNVFGGGDASNRRRRSAPSADEEDKHVEEQAPHGPSTETKDRSLRCQAPGTFNFSHLTRRIKIPTRCGRTPYSDTKGIIISNQNDSSHPARFMTETQVFGSGSSSRPASAPKVITTLGQEEKQYRNAANANRLQRLRAQMDQYEAQAAPRQDAYNVAQERRVRTLQRHQERYHQRIDEQRSRRARSPTRKGSQISSASSTAPCI